MEILLEDGRRVRGSVDELALDLQLFWLYLTDVRERKLFHAEDALSIWRIHTSKRALAPPAGAVLKAKTAGQEKCPRGLSGGPKGPDTAGGRGSTP